MKYSGIIIYLISIFLATVSIGINLPIYFLNKNSINKFRTFILLSLDVILISLFMIYLFFFFHLNNSLIIFLLRLLLQIGLLAILIFSPIYYFLVLKLSLKKYMFFLIIPFIIYFIISFLVIFVYYLEISVPPYFSAIRLINLIISTLSVVYIFILTLIHINRISKKFHRIFLLTDLIIQFFAGIIYVVELLIFDTCISVAIFFFIFDIIIIILTFYDIKSIKENDFRNIINDIKKAYNITEREIDVIQLLKNGLSYNDIADTLFISNKTVETHIYNIYKKTGAKNKIHLIKLLDQINS